MKYIIEKINNRNLTLDIYKGILIILVVIRHVLQYSVRDEGGVITNIIWAIQMPGFMIVAGFFSSRRIDDIRAMKNRLCTSLIHYFVPFISWFVIVDIIILGKYERNPLNGLEYLIYHIDCGLWFLWVVFILSLITNIANYLITKKKLIFTLAVLILFILGSIGIGCFAGISFLGIKYVLYYSVFYGFGWFIKWSENYWKKWWEKIESIVWFLSLLVFLIIVFNFDLYHAEDKLISIIIRCIAGFTGNAVVFKVCEKYNTALSKVQIGFMGMYTLEIYVTHMYVNHMMDICNSLFTVEGFVNFLCSLFFTVIFTIVIIFALKAIPLANIIFYGNIQKKSITIKE